MLIATAGHIDHGKTALVRALTGIETDRLPEEKKRGISIDLGFAYWRQPDGRTIGFVDVPGHERFIRNMIAGLCGVDQFLLVVAADDGVMPQTVEHVQILSMLGLRNGFAAISKCDRVSAERVEAVNADICKLLALAGLNAASPFPVSSFKGHGIVELATALTTASRQQPVPSNDDEHFRLSVDRAFSVPGAGTVAAGTVLTGRVAIGDSLTLSPLGQKVRIRGIQTAGQDVLQVTKGERCALNLAGLALRQVRRGDLLVPPEMHLPSTRVEALVSATPNQKMVLSHNSLVHLNIGTADVTARLLTLGQATIAPGTSALAELLLDKPISAVTGEAFILRDGAGRSLVGSGQVIDPFVPTRRRRLQNRGVVSAAYVLADPAKTLSALFAIPGHELNCTHFERCFNLKEATAQRLYAQAGATSLGNSIALPTDRLERICAQIVAAIEAFHAALPDLQGPRPRDLDKMIDEPISQAGIGAILKSLARNGRVELRGQFAKMPAHEVQFGPAEAKLWADLTDWLDEQGPLPFLKEEAQSVLGITEATGAALFYRRINSGDLVKFDDRRLILQSQVNQLADIAASLTGTEGFTAAKFRDVTCIGRNMVIRILEFLDEQGITKRRGDFRFIAEVALAANSLRK